MSFTPYNAPLLAGLIGDREIAGHFSVQAELSGFARFEAALARAEAACGVIPPAAADAIAAACGTFSADLADLGAATARDGVTVPAFVRQLRQAVGEPHGQHVHFGATSQDVIETSFMLRLKPVGDILLARLGSLIDGLDRLQASFGDRRLMARTRMQAALAVNVADRTGAWRRPLLTHQSRLDALLRDTLQVQLGGAAGTLDQLDEAGTEVRAALARELGLGDPGHAWHTDRSAVCGLAGGLSGLTGSLGKIGQDIALMAQNGIDEISLAGTGRSSAMAHKQNPVGAEVLVTLARFNAVQVSGLHHALVHEQERSGSAWMLEWMIMPQMIIAAGASLSAAISLLGNVTDIGQRDG